MTAHPTLTARAEAVGHAIDAAQSLADALMTLNRTELYPFDREMPGTPYTATLDALRCTLRATVATAYRPAIAAARADDAYDAYIETGDRIGDVLVRCAPALFELAGDSRDASRRVPSLYVKAEALSVGDTLLLPFNREARITDMKPVGPRTRYVRFRTVEGGWSRIEVGSDVSIKAEAH